MLLFFAREGVSAQEDFLLSLTGHPTTDKAVEKHVSMFTEALRKPFSRWLGRSGKYLGMMRQILQDNEIPEDIVFVSMIESGFSPYAYSRAKAVGPWQFMDFTAKRYGLKIDWWVDERRDPVKSTRAAASYLSDLYRMFGSWGLAMSAYNAGEGAVKRALDKISGTEYWDLYASKKIKPETKNYVPKFIAARMIAVEPERHGFYDINFEEGISYDEVVLWEPLDLDVAARCAGDSVEKLRELNPELTRWCTPPNVHSYILRIPKGTLMSFLDNLSPLTAGEKFPLRTYKIKKGDTLYKVAKKFNLPVEVVAELNGMKAKGAKKALKAGQTLGIPPEGKYKKSYLVAKK